MLTSHRLPSPSHLRFALRLPPHQEMDSDYREAVRRAILDYILLDPTEQQRLGLTMPEKVSVVALVRDRKSERELNRQ